MTMKSGLIRFIKAKRRSLGLTQRDLADRAGLGLRFIRDLEQGKESLRLDKVNQVLALFGHRMEPAPFHPEVDDEES
jgi:y4mF family transcriptional regulator